MTQCSVSRVLTLYEEADRAVRGFRISSGLSCPPGCSSCCSSVKVEATVLEMLPAAAELFSTCRAELLLKRLERTGEPRCLLFRPDLATPGGGGCTVYRQRALVCRLFGYAGSLDKHGVAVLARCKHMPAAPFEPPGLGRTGDGAAHPFMPIFQHYGVQLSAIDPLLGTERKPINRALFEALARVGLQRDLRGAATDRTHNDEPPQTPSTPIRSTRRRAA